MYQGRVRVICIRRGSGLYVSGEGQGYMYQRRVKVIYIRGGLRLYILGEG